jgi:hypothetical protein
MLEKSLHFPIKPGVVAAWNDRTIVIVGPTDGSSTRVHDVATGEERESPSTNYMAFRRLGKSRTLSKDGRWLEIPHEQNGNKRGVANGS